MTALARSLTSASTAPTQPLAESKGRILIAEDEPVSRRLLEAALVKWGYEVTATTNGREAFLQFQRENPPQLAIFDWMMPELGGLELARKLHANPLLRSTYIIMLTVKGAKEDVVRALETGANDYLTKPFDHGELRARVRVGMRVVQLQRALAKRVHELEELVAKVKQLQGLLPICSYCNRIRDDQNYWHRVESYISDHADVRFSHGICPECLAQLGPGLVPQSGGQTANEKESPLRP